MISLPAPRAKNGCENTHILTGQTDPEKKMVLVAISGLMVLPEDQYPQIPCQPQRLNSYEIKDRTGTDGSMSVFASQADDGARLHTKFGLADGCEDKGEAEKKRHGWSTCWAEVTALSPM